MKKTLLFQLLGLALIALGALSFQTQSTEAAARWELLGVRKVNYAVDHDEIMVTRAEGVFSALQIKVKASPINFHKIVVHYANGETQDIEVRENFRAGGQSRVIDLPGNKRIIRKVAFWYDTKNLAGRKALVQLWGRH